MASACETWNPDLCRYEALMVLVCLLLLMWLSYREYQAKPLHFRSPIEGFGFGAESPMGAKYQAVRSDVRDGMQLPSGVAPKSRSAFSGMFETPSFWATDEYASAVNSLGQVVMDSGDNAESDYGQDAGVTYKKTPGNKDGMENLGNNLEQILHGRK